MEPLAKSSLLKKPSCYLLFHNISKPKNIGTLIRSACAFNAEKVYLISKDPEKKKESKIMKAFGLRFGAQGTEDRIDYGFFYSISEAQKFFKENNVRIVGIEIGNDARNIYQQTPPPFEGDTVFILGNEGDGMHPSMKAICDYFVYIPQYTNKTASLNVAIAGSIVLAEFAKFAGYSQVGVHGEKFRAPEQDELDRKEKEAHWQGLKKRKAEENSQNDSSQEGKEASEEKA